MGLSETEKRALRSQQKLAYSSGQFPLRGQGPKRSPWPKALLVLALVVGGLVGLIATAIWMRG